MVLQAVAGDYDYISVDEVHDFNTLQWRIVRLLAGETGNVLLVGDDGQNIMT